MLSTVVQYKCWALWYKTNVEHCGTRQMLSTVVQDKCWALWYKTNVEHCGTIQLLSTVVRDKCWALWYNTSVEHCGTRQILRQVLFHDPSLSIMYWPENYNLTDFYIFDHCKYDVFNCEILHRRMTE